MDCKNLSVSFDCCQYNHTSSDENTIRGGGDTVDTLYTVDTVDMAYTVNMVCTVDVVYTVDMINNIC